ncbi:MAG TPA: 2-succinylbenzoate--CoA ligase, partial [Allocoleopsis sp.]
EWQHVLQLAQPDLIWSTDKECRSIKAWRESKILSGMPSRAINPNSKIQNPNSKIQNPQGWIMIPTGGSSGHIRFAIHTWETLAASVVGFQQYFNVDRIHSCCALPLYHVSGLMQFMRSFLSGGKLAIVPSHHLSTFIHQIDPTSFFLSLVPTQLHRLLHQSELHHPETIDQLARFHTILLGGAPAWDELLQTARQQGIRLAPTYGMTETASQIVTLKPEDFLQHQTGCGRVLSHAQIEIRDPKGQPVPMGEIGTIAIHADSLALGYYPDRFTSEWFVTDDLGFFDPQGYLHIVGRNSRKIITGGENVFPTEVEAAIRSTQLVKDVYVLGLPDSEWGERVTAVYVPIEADVPIEALQTALSTRLTKFKQPKTWIALPELPRNAQGKVNDKQVRQAIVNLKLQ